MRKSVSYLTSLRLETISTAEELHQLAFDLEAMTCDLTGLSPEQVRADMAVEHKDMVISLKKLHREIGRMLKAHELAAGKLRSFFF
jgi:hypothetical protein